MRLLSHALFALFLFTLCCFGTDASGKEYLKALPTDPAYKFSNLRQGKDKYGKVTLTLDFQRTRKSSGHTSCFINGKTNQGLLSISAVLPGFKDSGSLSMTLMSMSPRKGTPALNIELFGVAIHTIGEKKYVYSLISNPVRIGNPGPVTVGRPWSSNESAGLETHQKLKPLAIKRYAVTADLPAGSVHVPITAKLSESLKLEACYQSKWYPVTALSENSDGSVRVRWDDWGEAYDCNMVREELVIKKTILAKLDRHSESAFTVTPPPVTEEKIDTKVPRASELSSKPLKKYSVTIDVPGDSISVPLSAKLTPGTKLQACYANSWNPITFLGHNDDGTLTVRWDAYGPAFDCRMSHKELIIKKHQLRNTSQKPRRTWTDSTGRFKVQAELLGIDGNTVKLRTEAGKEVALPIKRLSKADRDYLDALETSPENPFE